MPSEEEEEISLTRWRDLLGTELVLALEELSKVRKDGVNKRHQHYVGRCTEDDEPEGPGSDGKRHDC
jgi:hypothetical protein